MSVDAVCLVWAYSTWTAKTEGGGGDLREGDGGQPSLVLALSTGSQQSKWPVSDQTPSVRSYCHR